MNIIIHKPWLMTKLQVWSPKYSTKYGNYSEEVVLLHKQKVDFASPVIIIEFTKAKHLAGQRFAIKKSDAQASEVGTNGSAPMYIVPMSRLSSYMTGAEERDLAIHAFDDLPLDYTTHADEYGLDV